MNKVTIFMPQYIYQPTKKWEIISNRHLKGNIFLNYPSTKQELVTIDTFCGYISSRYNGKIKKKPTTTKLQYSWQASDSWIQDDFLFNKIYNDKWCQTVISIYPALYCYNVDIIPFPCTNFLRLNESYPVCQMWHMTKLKIIQFS